MAFPGPPGGVVHMQHMTGFPGVPQGLEYLTYVDQVIVQQQVNLVEALTSIECANKFVVRNAAGQQIFFAGEDSNFCLRQMCGSRRGFVMHVVDNFGNVVIRVERDFKCCAGCCWCACVDCCAFEVRIESPIGVPVGYVRQSCSLIKPEFQILTEHREEALTLSGPICICNCPCFDVNFNLYTLDGSEVGKVSKKWSGLAQEYFTEAENFGISFPMDLDVKMKATLLGAVFLINMMFFEKKQEN